ncbi:MAG: hypothetical protein RR162_07110, partial [Oscillospiraceae bacterium]
MKENEENNGTCLNQSDNTCEILKYSGVQYWTYYPKADNAVPGINIMADLADFKVWDNFPQMLVDMGLICKDSVSDWLKMHRQIKAGQENVTCEIQLVEQGVPLWKKIHYHTTFDANGSAISSVGIAENISAYKILAENYARAAKQCTVSLWMFDFASRTIYDFSNASHIKAFEGITTMHDVPYVFAQPKSPLCKKDLPAMYKMYDKLYAGEKTASSIGCWKNEDSDALWWYETSYTSIFDESGKPIKAIGTAIDISERIRLEKRYTEEIKWRKVHNQDVLGSFKMNLTQNICEDGQSNNRLILDFQSDGTVDGFFANEYTAHIDAEGLSRYKNSFNRENLLKLFRSGKTSITQESY